MLCNILKHLCVCYLDYWPIFLSLLFVLFFYMALTNCCFYYLYMLPPFNSLYIYYLCTVTVLAK
jgi:hypothetical protein